MTLYQQWLSGAYDKNGHSKKAFWDVYMPLEQKIYENILENKDSKIVGTIAELADKYNMPTEYVCGFIDGIKEALDTEIDIENVEEQTVIDATINFTELYKRMVEYKADHLYNLSQWNAIFTEEERKELYQEQKHSRTIVKGDKIGRNDPCPCGSGKKYKRCCGASQ